VARNRKRAKERRARGAARPARRPIATPGIEEATPDAIEHATPDVELAEAQLAVGRPEPIEEDELEPVAATEPQPEGEPDEEYEDEEYDEDEEYEPEEGEGGNGGGPPMGTAVAPTGPGGAVPAPRPRSGNRLIGFLQGSWRELQRVQWPDRRQVVQATGVVIGFVIVAGLYLALADFVATKLVNYILK